MYCSSSAGALNCEKGGVGAGLSLSSLDADLAVYRRQ